MRWVDTSALKPKKQHFLYKLDELPYGKIALLFTAVIWVDYLFSTTQLITSINQTLNWSLIVIGGIWGLLCSMIVVCWERQSRGAYFTKRPISVIALWIAPPVVGAICGHYTAMRLSDFASFGFQSYPVETHNYPIVSLMRGGREFRPYILIHPSVDGDHAEIPITRVQYDNFKTQGISDKKSCVRVQQQRASDGAIHIILPACQRFCDKPLAVVRPCK